MMVQKADEAWIPLQITLISNMTPKIALNWIILSIKPSMVGWVKAKAADANPMTGMIILEKN